MRHVSESVPKISCFRSRRSTSLDCCSRSAAWTKCRGWWRQQRLNTSCLTITKWEVWVKMFWALRTEVEDWQATKHVFAAAVAWPNVAQNARIVKTFCEWVKIDYLTAMHGSRQWLHHERETLTFFFGFGPPGFWQLTTLKLSDLESSKVAKFRILTWLRIHF